MSAIEAVAGGSPLSSPVHSTKAQRIWKKACNGADQAFRCANSVFKIIRATSGVFKDLPVIISDIVVGIRLPNIFRLPWTLWKTARIARWIPLWSQLSLPISLIPVGFSIEDLTKLRGLKNCLDKKLDLVSKAKSDQEKAEALLDGLKRFQDDGIESLRKGALRISKSACQPKEKSEKGKNGKSGLELRVTKLMNDLQAALKSGSSEESKAIIGKATRFMEDLGQRVRVAQVIESIDLAAGVAAVAGAFFLTFTPFQLPGAVAVLAASVVSLGVLAGKAIFLRRDPFRDYEGDKDDQKVNNWRHTSRWEKLCAKFHHENRAPVAC